MFLKKRPSYIGLIFMVVETCRRCCFLAGEGKGRGADRMKVTIKWEGSYYSENARLSAPTPILVLESYSQRHCAYDNLPKFKTFQNYSPFWGSSILYIGKSYEKHACLYQGVSNFSFLEKFSYVPNESFDSFNSMEQICAQHLKFLRKLVLIFFLLIGSYDLWKLNWQRWIKEASKREKINDSQNCDF